MNLLFVCIKNQWTSPTAEVIYRDYEAYNVKSAGTEPSARIEVTAKLVVWADIIFAMEKRHKLWLIEKFPVETETKRIIVLDISDEYGFMDEELINDIKLSVMPYLENVKENG